jgi:ligand-binding sensor domain-containing protein
MVAGIMQDKSGNIWFASQDKGVFRYDTREPDGKGKAIKNITGKEGLGDNYAGGIAQDKNGNMWFTMKGGICRYDGKTFTEITTKDGLPGSEVWGFAMQRSGIIWITARGSTTRYDPAIPISNAKAFTVFAEGDINCCVQSMHEDSAGNMWFGTGQGVYKYDGKRIYQVKQNGPW